MKPTPLQRFFASPWPLWLWFGPWWLTPPAIALWKAGFEPSSLGNPLLMGYLALIAFGALLMGHFMGLLAGWFVMSPIYFWRGKQNGGPFSMGDRVQIIGGRFRGRQSVVIGQGQGESVRVELGPEAAARFDDYFSRFRYSGCRQT